MTTANGYEPRPLQVDPTWRRTPSFVGMTLLVVIEANLFAYLVASWLYLMSGAPAWPPPGIAPPPWAPSLMGLGLLLASSAVVAWGGAGLRAGRPGRLVLGLAGGVLLGLVFLVLVVSEVSLGGQSPQVHAYNALVVTFVGWQAFHVLAALVMAGVVLLRAILGHFTAERHAAVQNLALYWHFVVATWAVAVAAIHLPGLLP